MAVGDNWLVGPQDWTATMRSSFTRFSASDNSILAYPKLSKDLLQHTQPAWTARRYVGAITDFGRGQSDHILMNKMRNAFTETWVELTDEFSDVPQRRMSFTRWSVRVSEKGVSYALTERMSIFSTFDIESIVKTYLSAIVRNSIDRDIWRNALLWGDIVFAKTSAGLQILKGEAVGPAENRFSNTPGQFNTSVSTVTVPLINFMNSPLNNPEPISSADLLAVRAELIRRRMAGTITAVICNPVFERRLLVDPDLQMFFAYQRAEAISQANLGVVRGFSFIVDDTGILEETLNAVNTRPNPANNTQQLTDQYNAIAVFIVQDGNREAVVLPESVRTDVPVSFGRYTRVGVTTYRGESPIWLYADNEAYRDPNNTSQFLPEYVRRTNAVILLGQG